jgi:two-component system, sensor histidine kinase and response regulator
MQLGYEDDELKNEFDTFINLMHPEDREKVNQHLNDYLELRSEKYYIEFRMQHKNGNYHWILARAIAIRDAEGIPYRMSGSHTDITEIREIQEELKESNRTKDRFFSIIAHDLKSPLGTLMGLSDMMANNQANIPEESREKILQSIYKSSKTTFELLQNLLLWSRAQTGRVEYNPENINPIEILRTSLNLLENTAQEKEIRISIEEKDHCLIFVDKNMMDTVFRNLLANAIKFTPSGGKILLSVEIRGHKTEIKVSDSGIGIKEEDIPKLFKIDQSFSTKGTNQEEGTGLGLIICKEFVEKNKGELIVKSKLGKGSSFIISLPTVNK